MKRIFAVLLVFCLILALGGCAARETPATEAVEPSTEAAGDALSPAAGVFDGEVYVNELLGVSCAPGEGWTVLDEDGIATYFGYTLDMFSDENLRETIENSGSVIVFYALRDGGAQTLNISVSSNPNYGMLSGSESDLIEAMIPTMEQQLPLMGMEVQHIGLGDEPVAFAGAEHPCLRIAATLNELALHETQVLVCVDSYLFTVTAASYGDDVTDDILSMFAPLA